MEIQVGFSRLPEWEGCYELMCGNTQKIDDMLANVVEERVFHFPAIGTHPSSRAAWRTSWSADPAAGHRVRPWETRASFKGDIRLFHFHMQIPLGKRWEARLPDQRDNLMGHPLESNKMLMTAATTRRGLTTCWMLCVVPEHRMEMLSRGSEHKKVLSRGNNLYRVRRPQA